MIRNLKKKTPSCETRESRVSRRFGNSCEESSDVLESARPLVVFPAHSPTRIYRVLYAPPGRAWRARVPRACPARRRRRARSPRVKGRGCPRARWGPAPRRAGSERRRRSLCAPGNKTRPASALRLIYGKDCGNSVGLATHRGVVLDEVYSRGFFGERVF